MKHADFAYYLSGFFIKYLSERKGASVNTVQSYRDTFILLFRFLQDIYSIPAEKIELLTIQKEHIEKFLEWLEKERGCSVGTRNVRLSAIHSFYKYMQYELPDHLDLWQEILSIPKKKEIQNVMNYASLEGIQLLLKMPDQKTPTGRRDLALLSLMYDSGARVQEIVDLNAGMIRVLSPATVKLIGKGRKGRIVPLMDAQLKILKSYMKEHRLLLPENSMRPLFVNQQGERLTRAGIGYILQKYVKMAHAESPDIFPKKFSCHCMRHSKAMHMLQSGINLVYIRDFLGHTSIQTTEIYAKADSAQKRKALESAYEDIMPKTQEAEWQTNQNLLEWLKKL